MIVAALAFDVGMMLVERRDQQNAADAAALAGARYVLDGHRRGRSRGARPGADQRLRRRRRERGREHPHPGDPRPIRRVPGFIEVQIQSTRPSIFGGIIGRATWPVGALAVATNDQNLTFPFGMLALNPTECKAIAVSGGGDRRVAREHPVELERRGLRDAAGRRVQPDRWRDDRRHRAGCDVSHRRDVPGRRARGPPITCTKVAELVRAARPAAQSRGPSHAGPGCRRWCRSATRRRRPTTVRARRAGRRRRTIQTQICDVGGNGIAYRDLSWILYPGPVSRRPEVSNGAIAYLMPGIYWIGGGGLDVGGGGASIVTIGVATDATATPATNPCATATTTAALCGGVMFYNSKTASAAGGPVILNANAARMKIASLDLPSGRPERDLQRHRLLPGSDRHDAGDPERIVLVHR